MLATRIMRVEAIGVEMINPTLAWTVGLPCRTPHPTQCPAIDKSAAAAGDAPVGTITLGRTDIQVGGGVLLWGGGGVTNLGSSDPPLLSR